MSTKITGKNRTPKSFSEDELKAMMEKGVEIAREGQFARALTVFEDHQCFEQSPAATSYYALCLADVEGKYEEATTLCLKAVKKEFYNPEIYLNLGKVSLLNGQKADALKAFRNGLKLDDKDKRLRAEISQIGTRKRPVVSFLGRGNFVNKYLGKLLRKPK